MAIREILTYPNQLLRRPTETVTAFNDALKQLAADMIETMLAAPGVGLAANQVGACVSMVIIDVSLSREEPRQLVLVNPRIVESAGTQVDEEGCLSVVDYSAKVKRFRTITVCARDLAGKPLEFPAEDHFARVIQHEVDHLEGILFIDRLSSLKRALYKKQLKKRLKE